MNDLTPISPAAGAPALARSAPHNAEAEAGLLGAILVNNEAFYRVVDFLEPQHFYLAAHQKIFATISDLIRGGKVATPITVKTSFASDEQIGDISVAAYLLRLHADATSIINVVDYAGLVYELALKRMLIGIGEDMVNAAYDNAVDANARAQIESAERQLFSLAEKGRSEQGFVGFGSALEQAIHMATAAFQRDGGLSGLPSYFRNLDNRMGGLQKSDLIILAGRPAMGKTSLATNIAYNIAKNWRGGLGPNNVMETEAGGIVGFFSLEMSSEQLATRILAEQSGVSSSRIRRGDIKPDEFEKVVMASQEMHSVPLYIDQTGGLTVGQLAARARRLKRQKGLDVLIVDYLQLLQGSSRRSSENRVQEITEITTGLKALAKELDVPILALSQLSRQVEAREDKRPQLSDLRESGSIEQDADVVLFVFREEYYLQSKEPKPGTEEHVAWVEEMERIHGLAEVIIGKQRHGPTGTAKLTFEAELTRFGDYIEDDHVAEHF
ncbi:MAG: replicative DNA helicase [Devosiaceae bacterium]|nr:replicative DNA helicase [Devosiaceae bacterium MH13]